MVTFPHLRPILCYVGREVSKMYFPRVKELRLEHKLTQAEVAQNIHVSRSTYCRFEKGSGSLKLTPLIKLLDLYQISADYLAGFSDNRHA